MIWFYIGVGGALGAMARHAVNHVVHQRLLATTFPLGILAINVLGSAAIGVLAGLIASDRLNLSLELRTFLIVGVLGGFTTFSSFSLDTLTLIKSGQTDAAFANIAGQVGLSLIAVWCGYRVGAWS